MVTQVLRRPGQVGIFDRLIVVFSTIAPGSMHAWFGAPKFAAQSFLLVGKDGKTYGRVYTRGTQTLLEFYDSKAL